MRDLLQDLRYAGRTPSPGQSLDIQQESRSFELMSISRGLTIIIGLLLIFWAAGMGGAYNAGNALHLVLIVVFVPFLLRVIR